MDRDQMDLELLKMAAGGRELEIKYFWQRSLFFWGFIVTTAYAYGAVARWSDRSRLAESLLAHFGFFCSFCWCYVNKGSKYGYESWEKKLQDLERAPAIKDRIEALLRRESKERWLFTGLEPVEDKRFGPAKYSVSKITILLSEVVTLLWVAIVIRTYVVCFGVSIPADCIKWIRLMGSAMFSAVTALLIWLLIHWCRTSERGESRS
jgi:hypothetical protein